MKILQLCNKSPYPPKDGGAIAIFNLTKGFQNNGHHVKILAINTKKHYVNPDIVVDALKDIGEFEFVYLNTNVPGTLDLQDLVEVRRQLGQSAGVVHVLVGHHVEVQRGAIQHIENVIDHRSKENILSPFSGVGVPNVDEDVTCLGLTTGIAIGHRDQEGIAEEDVVDTYSQPVHSYASPMMCSIRAAPRTRMRSSVDSAP